MKAQTIREETFRFRLYVAGRTSNSRQAVTNLAGLCRTHLPGRHEVEVIDVLREPQRALAEGVFVTPMLIKIAPAPKCRVIGALHDTEQVLWALERPSPPA